MSAQTITTHISGAQAKQLVQNLCSAYDQIRQAERSVADAQKAALRARYEWGRKVHNALEVAERGDAVAKEVGRRIDRSATWVRQHARFARAVEDRFVGYTPPVDGYIEDCEAASRSLAWRVAVSWMSSEGGESDTTEVERLRRDVERELEALEEKADELAETYLGGGDDLDESERRAVEGVLSKAKQALEDNQHLADRLAEEAPERAECAPYLRFVKDHACCRCGVIDDTVVPHHPKEAYPSRGGTARKIDDFLAVPLCHDCHHAVEEGEGPSWPDTDPRVVAADLQNKFLRRLVA